MMGHYQEGLHRGFNLYFHRECRCDLLAISRSCFPPYSTEIAEVLSLRRVSGRMPYGLRAHLMRGRGGGGARCTWFRCALPPCVLKDAPAELSFCPNGVCWAVTVRKCTPRTALSLSKPINWWRNGAGTRTCPPKSDLLADLLQPAPGRPLVACCADARGAYPLRVVTFGFVFTVCLMDSPTCESCLGIFCWDWIRQNFPWHLADNLFL